MLESAARDETVLEFFHSSLVSVASTPPGPTPSRSSLLVTLSEELVHRDDDFDVSLVEKRMRPSPPPLLSTTSASNISLWSTLSRTSLDVHVGLANFEEEGAKPSSSPPLTPVATSTLIRRKEPLLGLGDGEQKGRKKRRRKIYPSPLQESTADLSTITDYLADWRSLDEQMKESYSRLDAQTR